MKTSNDSSVSSLGCLYGVVRRIVCGNIHNANPQIIEEIKTETETETEKKKLRPTSPGLVARLMGLDPMPEIGPDNNNNSIRRSRSTNSTTTESWSGFLSGHSSWGTAKSSRSFREVPTFLRKENEDFLLLSFGTEEDINGGEAFKKRSKKKKKKKNCCAPAVKVVDFECSSQNSSPVSVLDRPELDSPISGEKPSSSLSVDLKSDIFFPAEAEAEAEAEEIYKSKEATSLRAVVNTEKKISGRRQEEALSHSDVLLLWRHIREVAEEDHKKSDDWVSMELPDGKWEVATVIEMDTMDSLLHETVLVAAQLSICKLPPFPLPFPFREDS